MVDFLVHEDTDTVGVVVRDVEVGENLVGRIMDSNVPIELTVKENIPLGHKLATKAMTEGETVMKYGHDIGRTIAAIEVGAYVHVHNTKTKRW